MLLFYRGETRRREFAVCRFEDDPYTLSDPDIIEVAIYDVRHHRYALVERDVSYGVGNRAVFARDAEGINCSRATRFDPPGLLAEAKRTMSPRIIHRLIACIAFLDEQATRSAPLEKRFIAWVRL